MYISHFLEITEVTLLFISEQKIFNSHTAVCENARHAPSPTVPTIEQAHRVEYKERPIMISLTLKYREVEL